MILSADMLLALELAGLGMGYVFAFLGALVLFLYLNARLVKRSAHPDEKDALGAAIAAAAIHHKRKKT